MLRVDETGVLQRAAQRVGLGELFQLLLDPEHLHDGEIRAHRHARAAAFEAAKRHGVHAGALSDLLRGQPPPQARQTQPFPELPEQFTRSPAAAEQSCET